MLKELKLQLYRPSFLQALHEDNNDMWFQFCKTVTIGAEADPNILRSILWSDEARFKLNGRVNLHNCGHWSDTKDIVIQKEIMCLELWYGEVF